MELNSVRDLKTQLLNEFVLPEKRFDYINTFRNLKLDRDVFDSPIAFGIAPSENKTDQFKLAVRLAVGHEHLLQSLQRYLPKANEVDLVTGVDFHALATSLVAQTPYQERPSNDLVLKAGYSCGHYRITAGTLGGFVQDKSGKTMILSNNHVIANCDSCSKGDKILQPGPYDIDKKNPKFDVIGYLSKWVPLSATRRDGVDAAIADLSENVTDVFPHSYDGIGQIKPSVVEDRYEVKNVIKRGRTTKVTTGAVSAFEVDGVRVGYGGGKVITFDGLVEFLSHKPAEIPFGKPGDSGSVIFCAETLRPYALLFAGGTDHRGYDRTLANFMPDVMDKLEVRWAK